MLTKHGSVVDGLRRWGIPCVLMLALAGLQAQTVVRLHGAITMEKLLSAQRQALQTQAGVRVELVGNGSGRGLADLSAGLADVAMIGGSLKGVAEATNKEKPGSVSIDGMREIPLAAIKLVVIAHPSAGVKSLTGAQLRDVLSGKAKSWKEAGGADLPIRLVLPFAGDGARISIQESLLKGADFAKDAILRNSSKDLAVVVTQVPGACAFLSAKNAEGSGSIIPVAADLAMPMQFIVKGEMAPEVKKVVEFAKTVIK